MCTPSDVSLVASCISPRSTYRMRPTEPSATYILTTAPGGRVDKLFLAGVHHNRASSRTQMNRCGVCRIRCKKIQPTSSLDFIAIQASDHPITSNRLPAYPLHYNHCIKRRARSIRRQRFWMPPASFAPVAPLTHSGGG